jgi:hypothetical protein
MPPAREGKAAVQVAIQATPEWRNYLPGLARHVRAPSIAALVDLAVVRLAESVGYSAPPLR